MFTYDTPFVAHNLDTLVWKSGKTVDLKINLKKTGYIPAPQGSNDIDQDKEIESQGLKQVNKFRYFGSIAANNIRLNTEQDTQNGFKVIFWLRIRVWIKKDRFIKIKCTVYRSSLNPLVRCRNLHSIRCRCQMTSALYKTSIAQNIKCQVAAVYPK